MPSQTKLANYYALITFTGLFYLSFNAIAEASIPNSQVITPDRLSWISDPSDNTSSSPASDILVDFLLPDINGLELLVQLQAQFNEFALPVIILTGQGNEVIAV